MISFHFHTVRVWLRPAKLTAFLLEQGLEDDIRGDYFGEECNGRHIRVIYEHTFYLVGDRWHKYI